VGFEIGEGIEIGVGDRKEISKISTASENTPRSMAPPPKNILFPDDVDTINVRS
jgi:hypothetical protein